MSPQHKYYYLRFTRSNAMAVVCYKWRSEHANGIHLLFKINVPMQHYTVELNDESKDLCTIATRHGLCKYNRLAMGPKCVLRITKKCMGQMLGVSRNTLKSVLMILVVFLKIGNTTFNYWIEFSINLCRMASQSIHVNMSSESKKQTNLDIGSPQLV